MTSVPLERERGNFYSARATDHRSLEFEYASSRPNIVSAFEDLLKPDRRIMATLGYIDCFLLTVRSRGSVRCATG